MMLGSIIVIPGTSIMTSPSTRGVFPFMRMALGTIAAPSVTSTAATSTVGLVPSLNANLARIYGGIYGGVYRDYFYCGYGSVKQECELRSVPFRRQR